MYIPPLQQFTNHEVLFSLVATHPLGAWVHPGRDDLLANHLPFLLDRRQGPLGTLIGHVSRANPVWRALKPGRTGVVMFQGPQSCITPGWYPSKAEHGKAVPTWNCVAAHAHGVIRSIEDRDWILDMLRGPPHAQEAKRPQPWSLAEAPARVDQMPAAIPGIEMPIGHLVGKLKASHHEATADRRSTVDGLRQPSFSQARVTAKWMSAAVWSDPP